MIIYIKYLNTHVLIGTSKQEPHPLPDSNKGGLPAAIIDENGGSPTVLP